jgi:chromosome segregation ATPase/phage tail protein X
VQAELENARRTLGELTAAQTAAAQAATTAGQDRRERDDLRQQLESARQELAAARDAGEKSAAALAQAGEHRQTAEAKLAEQSAQLAAFAAERDQLHQQLTLAAGAAKTDASRLQGQTATLTQQLESTRQELASAKEAGADLTAQVKKLAGEKEAFNRQLAERGEGAQRLAGVTSRLEDARQELLLLKNDNAELSDKLRDATKERDRLSKAVRSEQSTHQLEEAQAAIARLQREKADLQTEQASLTTRLAQTAAAATTSLTAATAGSADEIVRLKQELAKSGDKVDMTVRSFALAQQENEQLKKQIEQSAGEHTTPGAQAQQELAALRTQLAGATSSGEGTSAEVTRLNGELAAARDAAGKAAADNASLREFSRQTQNTGASLASENARLRTALAVASRAPAAATSQPTRPVPVTVAAAAPAAPAPAAPPTAPRTYRVASGDTLSRISSRYYGTASRWQDIYNANRDQLRSPDVLPLGVELKIP